MADLTNAIAYIGSQFGPTYRAWEVLGEDRQRTLVTAAGMLDRLPWQGTATHLLDGQPTTLAWPRSGVVIDGVAVDSLTVPTDITTAEYELAVLLVGDPDLPNAVDQGTNIKSVGAGGGVAVEFFAPTSAATGTATRLPPIVMQLVGKYLAQASTSTSGDAGLGSAYSAFSRRRAFTVGEGV